MNMDDYFRFINYFCDCYGFRVLNLSGSHIRFECDSERADFEDALLEFIKLAKIDLDVKHFHFSENHCWFNDYRIDNKKYDVNTIYNEMIGYTIKEIGVKLNKSLTL